MGGDSDERTRGSKIQLVATELDLPDLKGRLKGLRAPSKGGALNFFWGISMLNKRDLLSLR